MSGLEAQMLMLSEQPLVSYAVKVSRMPMAGSQPGVCLHSAFPCACWYLGDCP